MKRVQFKTTGSAVHNVIAEVGDYYILDGHPTNWGQCYQVAIPKSAMNVVVEVTVVEEVTYKTGQRFKIGDQLVILAQHGSLLCALIKLDDGNKYANTVKVHNPERITQDELNRMSCTPPVLVT